MEVEKIQRRYPDNGWDYKAISTIVYDNGIKRNVIYHHLIDRGVTSTGVEVYTGPNFMDKSTDRNYSRSYPIDKCPKKYQSVVNELIKIHNETEWSDKKYVNQN